MEMLEKDSIDMYIMNAISFVLWKTGLVKTPKRLNNFFPVDYTLIAKGSLLHISLFFLSSSSRQAIELTCLDFVKYDKISQSVLTVKSLQNFLVNGFWKNEV